MKLTEEQWEIIEAKDKNIVVNAYAGSGKSTTIKYYIEKNKDKKFLYLVYNNSMRKEAKKKFKGLKNVDIHTIHSFYYSLFGWRFKDNLGNLDYNTLKDLINTDKIEEEFSYLYINLIKKAFIYYLNYDEKEIDKSLLKSFYKFCSDTEKYILKINWRRIVKEIKRLLDLMKDAKIPVSFDLFVKLGQFYPKYVKEKIKKYDGIIIDEAQDITLSIIPLIKMFENQDKIVLIVGDKYQQIYSWRYAVSMLERFENYNKLYLTKSFRFGDNLASYVSDYLELAFKEKNRVRGENKLTRIDIIKSPNLSKTSIISRTNAYLIMFALSKLDNSFYFPYNLKQTIFYNEELIGNLLLIRNGYVSPLFPHIKSLEELIKYCDDIKDYEMKGLAKLINNFGDNYSKIMKALLFRVKKTPEEADFILTTAHRSKGLEFDKVYLASNFKILKSEVKNKDEYLEEKRLFYVALTRAKSSIFLNSKLNEKLNKFGLFLTNYD